MEEVVKEVLGENCEISDGTLNKMLEDKGILEATTAFKVGMKNNDKAVWMTSRHNLWMLLATARWDIADYDDKDIMMTIFINDDE